MTIDDVESDSALFDLMIREGLDTRAVKARGYSVVGHGTMSIVFKKPDDEFVVKVNEMPDRCWNAFIGEFVSVRRADPHLPRVIKHEEDKASGRGYAVMELLDEMSDREFMAGFYAYTIRRGMANVLVRMAKKSSKELADAFESRNGPFCETLGSLHEFAKSTQICRFDLLNGKNVMSRAGVPVITDLLA